MRIHIKKVNCSEWEQIPVPARLVFLVRDLKLFIDCGWINAINKLIDNAVLLEFEMS